MLCMNSPQPQSDREASGAITPLKRLRHFEQIMRQHPQKLVQPREQRRKLRMACCYIATVRGRDADGHAFEIGATVADLSACGLSLRLQWRVPTDARLFILVQLSPTSQLRVVKHTRSIAMRGVVRRSKIFPSGVCEVGVEFHKHRFI
jgi:hypothetical protein